MFTNTIFPLNMEFRNSIIAATSPQSEDSFNHHLINLRNPITNQLVYNVVYLYEVCKPCLDAGKPWKCTHMQEQLSDSKRQDTVDEVRLGYRAGQTAAKLRETFGVTTSGGNRLIPDQYISQFFAKVIEVDPQPRCIYMGIDPSGGGDSEMGVVAIVESFTAKDFMKLAVSQNSRFSIVLSMLKRRSGTIGRPPGSGLSISGLQSSVYQACESSSE